LPFEGVWREPFSQDHKDISAAERARQFTVGWFAHPVFVNGDYPDVMKQLIAAKSLVEGRSQSRLPEFTDSEKKFIAGIYAFTVTCKAHWQFEDQLVVKLGRRIRTFSNWPGCNQKLIFKM
jgi:beta-glucosidase/6-phospho-beta-glucosidase/beta-galactosidase